MTARKSTQRLYFIENNELPTGHQFASFEDLKRFVDDVVTSPAFFGLRNSCPRKVNVKCNGDHNYSEAVIPNDIWIAKSHWYPSIVLHELAHLLVADGRHTREFLYGYLYLLEQFMGAATANTFRLAFEREKLLPR